MALRTVGVKLAAEVSSYVAGMRTAKTATKDFVGELDKAAKAGQLDAIADRAAYMGVALGAAFAGVVAITARFDKQMSEVGAVANATASDLDRLRQAALDAGKDTAFSATEAAKAEAELAKAGLSTSEILGGALSGSLSLAAAGTLDLAESADIAAKTMNVFQLEGKDVGHIADVLAAAANKSATDVHEMGEALRMGGLAANSAGMSLEETVGTLSAFADRALVGSDAGTSLKTMLQMLAAPSEKAANLMEQLGIHAYDLQGNFIGTTKLAANLERAFGGLTQEQRNAAMATIFGADAMRAANVLFEVGEQGIKDYTAAVDDQGAAAEVAAKKMDNLAGDVEKLKGSLETMAIEAGSGANSGIRVLVQAVDGLVGRIAALPPAVGSTVTVLAGLGAVLALGLAAWIKSRRAIALAVAELNAVGPAGARAATGLQLATKWAGRAAAAFVALEVVNAVFDAFKPAAANVDKLSDSLQNLIKTGNSAGELNRLFGDDLSRLGREANFATGRFSGFARSIEGMVAPVEGLNRLLFGTSFTDAADDFEALDAAMANVVTTSGKADGIKLWNQVLRESGLNADELIALLPQYAQAMRDADTATGGAATAIGEVGAAAGLTAEQVQELKDAFDRLFGIQMDLDRAVIAYKEGIQELNDELKTGSRTINANTEEGRENRSAVLDQIDAIKDLRQARIDHGMSLEDANTAYQKDIAGLQAQMRAAGFTEEQITALTDAYYKVPDEVSTDVKAPGATTATKQVETFNSVLRTVPPSKRVPFYTTASEARSAVEALRLKIAQIKSKKVNITAAVYWTSSGDLHVPGGTQIKNRWGGVYEHAREGKLRESAIFSPAGPARYAFAEPATGGEAFIPRLGDMNRSRAIWEHVGENWLGMKDRPDWSGYWPMTTASRVEVVARWIGPPGASGDIGRALAQFIQLDVWDRGSGDVQRAYGKRR